MNSKFFHYDPQQIPEFSLNHLFDQPEGSYKLNDLVVQVKRKEGHKHIIFIPSNTQNAV